jgi:hypothetical protein
MNAMLGMTLVGFLLLLLCCMPSTDAAQGVWTSSTVYGPAEVLYLQDGYDYAAIGYNKGSQYIDTITGGVGIAPWTLFQNHTNSNWNTYNYAFQTDAPNYVTLFPSQAIIVESCTSGPIDNSRDNRDVVNAVILRDEATNEVKYQGFNSWTTMVKGQARSICTQALVPYTFLQSFLSPLPPSPNPPPVFERSVQVWARSNGGNQVTNGNGVHVVVARTFPLQQYASTGSTYQAVYSQQKDTSQLDIPKCTTPAPCPLVFHTGVYDSIVSDGSMPWSFASTPTPTPGTVTNAISITNAALLSNQRIDVTASLSGISSSINNNYEYSFMYCLNGTTLPKTMCSGKAWSIALNAGVATQVHVPMSIPNRFLVNGATLNFYGSTTYSSATKLTSAVSFRVVLNSQREFIN